MISSHSYNTEMYSKNYGFFAHLSMIWIESNDSEKNSPKVLIKSLFLGFNFINYSLNF